MWVLQEVYPMMKNLYLMLLMIVMITACNGDTQPTPTLSPLPHAMKGYELYSWPVGDDWHFTLMTGTNRLKTLEEITTGGDMVDPEGWVKISVVGLTELKETLSRLPRGEQIFWVGGWYLFFDKLVLPPQEIIQEVEAYCRQLGLELLVSE
jgi:hypothetical protein